MARPQQVIRGLAPWLAALLILYACRPTGPDQGPPTGPQDEPTLSVTLEWDPPVTDATGAPLDDLAGYRLYFGAVSPLSTTRDTFIDVGLATTWTLDRLSPGTWYFATTAFDDSGNESGLSAELRAELAP